MVSKQFQRDMEYISGGRYALQTDGKRDDVKSMDFRVRKRIMARIEYLAFMAEYLHKEQHAQVFNLERIAPIFEGLANHINKRELDRETSNYIMDEKLFELLVGIANYCYELASKLYSTKFQQLTASFLGMMPTEGERQKMQMAYNYLVGRGFFKWEPKVPTMSERLTKE